MRILIAGATGLIGSALVDLCLVQGIEVNYLTTRRENLNAIAGCKGFYWSPEEDEIDLDCFKQVSVIINLAGASISKRWTPSYKKEIINSRINSAAILKQSLKKIKHEVIQYVSASAIGIYPSSLTNYYTEDEVKTDHSFLGEVVKMWEHAADAFQSLGIIVTKIRIGLVLSHKGGFLPKILKPAKLGLASAFGSGLQWQSWIHIQDLSSIFLHTIRFKLSGVYNGVAPNPVTNKELVRITTKTLESTMWLPNVPRFMLRIILGEMHMIIFSSHRVSSKKIENLGFNFQFHHLENSIEDLIEKE